MDEMTLRTVPLSPGREPPHGDDTVDTLQGIRRKEAKKQRN